MRFPIQQQRPKLTGTRFSTILNPNQYLRRWARIRLNRHRQLKHRRNLNHRNNQPLSPTQNSSVVILLNGKRRQSERLRPRFLNPTGTQAPMAEENPSCQPAIPSKMSNHLGGKASGRLAAESTAERFRTWGLINCGRTFATSQKGNASVLVLQRRRRGGDSSFFSRTCRP